jgi:hypothetical protein
VSAKLKIDGRTHGSIEAEALAAALCLTKAVLRPKAARDDKRQAGTQKKRRPEINEWIADQLKRDPKVKSPELWKRRPDWIANPREYDPIGYRAFAQRVTDVRKIAR